MQQKYIIHGLTILATETILALAIRPVFAIDSGFGLYPRVTEVIASPGETKQVSLSLKNNSGEVLLLTPLLQPFTSKENGEVVYQTTVPKLFRSVTVLDNGEPISELSLAPFEEKNVTVQIGLPKTAPQGDYYFSTIFLTKPEPSNTTAETNGISASSSISSGVASHIVLAVAPSNSGRLQLQEFSTPALAQTQPSHFTVKIANTGPTFTNITGTIRVFNVLGLPVDYTAFPRTLLLANSSRTLSSQGKSSLTLPGIYRATVQISSDRQPSPITKSIYFVIAPVQLFIIIFCICLIFYAIKKRVNNR